MKVVLLVCPLLVCLLFVPASAWAQDPVEHAAPQSTDALGVGPLEAPGSPRSEPAIDKKFRLAGLFLLGATAFDAESTFTLILDGNHRAHEANILMRPIVNRGRLPTYVVLGAMDGAVLFLSHKFKKDGKASWWVGPVAIGVAHLAAGSINVRIQKGRQ